jgi:hypothetical protein
MKGIKSEDLKEFEDADFGEIESKAPPSFGITQTEPGVEDGEATPEPSIK